MCKFSSDDPTDRPRALLPLPVSKIVAPPPAALAHLSRGTLRRVRARHAKEEMVRRCVVALNEMDSGGVEDAVTANDFTPNLVQSMALSHIREAVDDFGPPPDGLTTEVALQAPGQHRLYGR